MPVSSHVVSLAAAVVVVDVLLLFILLSVCHVPTVATAAVVPNDVGVWTERTALYFHGADGSDAPALSGHGSIVSLADWSGDLNPGLLVLAPYPVGDHGNRTRNLVELYSSGAVSKQETTFSRGWVAPPLPEGVSVVSATAADLRRSGNLDLLLQGDDGLLYMAKCGVEPKGGSRCVPQTPRRLSIVTPAGASALDTPQPSWSLRYAASPQVAVVVLGSDYPSLVFVNENGGLVELRWRGRRQRRGSREDAEADVEVDYEYEVYELVSSSPTLSEGTAAVNADGSPAGLQLGVKEVAVSSLAMADIDGDCVAELLYAVRDGAAKTLSLYAYQPLGIGNSSEQQQGRKHAKLMEFAETDGQRLGSLTVADVDGDGAVDFVFPWRNVSRSADSSVEGYTGVMVFYSQPFASHGCSDRGSLPSTQSYQYSNTGDALVLLSEDYCGAEQRQPTEEEERSGSVTYLSLPEEATLPLILRTGDYNRDGRVDFVVPSGKGPLVLTATGGRGSNTAFPGSAKTKTTSSSSSPPALLCKYLDETAAAASTSGLSSGQSWEAYRSAVPFFVSLSEEVGRLDIALTSHRVTGAAFNRVYSNEELPDRNYYILASALNGAHVMVAAASTAATAGRQAEGFGLAQPSAVHYVAWEDVRMTSRWRRTTQLSQYVGYALQPPRLLIGLGETFSYIRGFTVSIPSPLDEEEGEGTLITTTTTGGGGGDGQAAAPPRKRQWPSYLVPNSQVFAVLHPVDSPSNWRLRLYLPTSRYKLLIGVVLLVWLVVLGVPLVVLRWQEMRADLREWKRR